MKLHLALYFETTKIYVYSYGINKNLVSALEEENHGETVFLFHLRFHQHPCDQQFS